MSNNKVFIRRANLNDLAEILRLNLELFKEEYKNFDKTLDITWTYGKIGKSYFKSRITKKSGFVEVIENEGKIIGYLCGGISRTFSYRIKAKYAELDNMFIEKKFRGRGLGSKLIKDLLRWCNKNKVDYAFVNASVQNKYAISVYRKEGLLDAELVLRKKLK